MKPVLCHYYVTSRCNSKCVYCDIWLDKNSSKTEEQTKEQILNNLVNLKKLGIKLIDFTGGEPLLYNNLIYALTKAKELGFYTTVTTNCLLYPKYANELNGLVDVLQFSMDSTNPAEHDSTRGVKSHSSVITSIEIAKQINQKFI